MTYLDRQRGEVQPILDLTLESGCWSPSHFGSFTLGKDAMPPVQRLRGPPRCPDRLGKPRIHRDSITETSSR